MHKTHVVFELVRSARGEGRYGRVSTCSSTCGTRALAHASLSAPIIQERSSLPTMPRGDWIGPGIGSLEDSTHDIPIHRRFLP